MRSNDDKRIPTVCSEITRIGAFAFLALNIGGCGHTAKEGSISPTPWPTPLVQPTFAQEDLGTFDFRLAILYPFSTRTKERICDPVSVGAARSVDSIVWPPSSEEDEAEEGPAVLPAVYRPVLCAGIAHDTLVWLRIEKSAAAVPIVGQKFRVALTGVVAPDGRPVLQLVSAAGPARNDALRHAPAPVANGQDFAERTAAGVCVLDFVGAPTPRSGRFQATIGCRHLHGSDTLILDFELQSAPRYMVLRRGFAARLRPYGEHWSFAER